MDTKFCKENLIVNEDILMRKTSFPNIIGLSVDN